MSAEKKTKTVKKAAVIGAGVMGAGIAAHLANAGIEVVLLDIVPKDPNADRSLIAKSAIDKMLKTSPAPFMNKRNAKLIIPGNQEDDLDKLADADWIIEAVIENPAIKAQVFKKIDAHRKPGSVVSSNTSTIPLEILTQGQSDAFKKDFIITHFFNPPRYMPLLEMVPGKETDLDAYNMIADFADKKLGKTVVHCKDTPGFIANRIGTFWIQAALNGAFDLNIDVETADAVMGKPLGYPKSGIFGLVDLVGLDLMPHISKSLLATLPANDEYRNIQKDFPLVTQMIADGYTGRKGKGGFYRLNRTSGGKVKETIDLQTGEYRPSKKAERLASIAAGKDGLRAVLETSDVGGVYAWTVLGQVLSYAAALVPEINDDIRAVDAAMRTGYNWTHGPFEMLDMIGADWFVKRLEADGAAVPAFLRLAQEKGGFYRHENGKSFYLKPDGTYAEATPRDGVLKLSEIKRFAQPLLTNNSASLWDIGDGVVCLEFHSKANSIDPDILGLTREAIELVKQSGGQYKALVLHNEGEHFSTGANLMVALEAAQRGGWDDVEKVVKNGQDTMRALKFAPFPVVGAPSGMALGGGCEFLLHCDAVQAHSETYMGLVEVGVGLIPGWGGCKEMLLRAQELQGKYKLPGGPMPPVMKSFETISTAKVGLSADENKGHLYMRAGDGITMNKDRLLADAKAKALELAKDYKAPDMRQIALPGATGRAALNMAVDGFYAQGLATHYDVVVSDALAQVLSGGETDITEKLTEDQIMELERKVFMTLVQHPGTANRIMHMMTQNKPLREAPLTEAKTTKELRATRKAPDLSALEAANDDAPPAAKKQARDKKFQPK